MLNVATVPVADGGTRGHARPPARRIGPDVVHGPWQALLRNQPGGRRRMPDNHVHCLCPALDLGSMTGPEHLHSTWSECRDVTRAAGSMAGTGERKARPARTRPATSRARKVGKRDPGRLQTTANTSVQRASAIVRHDVGEDLTFARSKEHLTNPGITRRDWPRPVTPRVSRRVRPVQDVRRAERCVGSPNTRGESARSAAQESRAGSSSGARRREHRRRGIVRLRADGAVHSHARSHGASQAITLTEHKMASPRRQGDEARQREQGADGPG